MNLKTAHKLIIIIALFISAFLIFYNLDNAYMWDDEAQVGIIARNFLQTGKLTGWDGVNLFGYRNGTLLDKNLRPINPPMDYYITAASYFIFGKINTWTSRFPHVLIGFIGVLIFIFFVKDFFKEENPVLLIFSTIGLCLSVILILYLKQCRYYAEAITSSICILYFYSKYLHTSKLKYLISLSIFSILLFYCQFLICVVFLLSLTVSHLICYHSHINKKTFKDTAYAASIFLISTIPYAIYFKIWQRPDSTENINWLTSRIKLLYLNFKDINLFYFSPYLLIIVFATASFFIKTKNRNLIKKYLFILTLIISNTFFTSLLSIQLIQYAKYADVRYLICIIPLGIILSSIFLYIVFKHVNKLAAILLLIIFTTTNLYSYFPYSNWEFKWLLPAYLREMTHKYPTATEETSKYIKEHIPQNSKIFVNPNYKLSSLMFYAPNYKYIAQLNQNSKIKNILPLEKYPYLYQKSSLPDYIILFGFFNLYCIDFFNQQLKINNIYYKKYQLFQTFKIFHRSTQLPELIFHKFIPVTINNAFPNCIYIYQICDT